MSKKWLNAVQQVKADGDEIQVSKFELEGRMGIRTMYLLRFGPVVEAVSVRYSSDYDIEHRELERSHAIDHSLTECPERFHPRPIRMWTPSGAWKKLPLKLTDMRE